MFMSCIGHLEKIFLFNSLEIIAVISILKPIYFLCMYRFAYYIYTIHVNHTSVHLVDKLWVLFYSIVFSSLKSLKIFAVGLKCPTFF